MSEKMILHACCGPCSIFPTMYLKENNIKFALYFYNPNIHPYQEFKKRLRALREYAEEEKIRLVIDKNYDLEDFLVNALKEKIRCEYCYYIRMQQTAEYAKNNGYTSFTTTLLGSPYQDHERIKEACFGAAEKFGVEFKYFDFRSGFDEGTRISKEKDMYRQSYCGCVLSERDRYEKKKNNSIIIVN